MFKPTLHTDPDPLKLEMGSIITHYDGTSYVCINYDIICCDHVWVGDFVKIGPSFTGLKVITKIRDDDLMYYKIKKY